MSIDKEILKDPETGAKLLEKEYKAGLISFARRLCPDDSEAEALVYRTFAEVVKGIDGYTDKQAFFGWMCKILVNCRANETRRKSNKTVVPMAELPDAPDDSASQVFRAIDANILRDAVENLPPAMKEVVVLHYFMEQPLGKVASLLSQPIGTVKSRLHYARILLGQRLGAELKKPMSAIVVLALLLVGATAAIVANVTARSEAPTVPKYTRTAVSQPMNLNTMRIARRNQSYAARCSAKLDGGLDTGVRAVQSVAAGPVDTVVRGKASVQVSANDIVSFLIILR